MKPDGTQATRLTGQAGNNIHPDWFDFGPARPHTPTPADQATDITTNTTLSWACEDATGYDIYLDTDNPPQGPALATDHSTTNVRTRCFSAWNTARPTTGKMVAADDFKAAPTTGPIWALHHISAATLSPSCPIPRSIPPTRPAPPSPWAVIGSLPTNTGWMAATGPTQQTKRGADHLPRQRFARRQSTPWTVIGRDADNNWQADGSSHHPHLDGGHRSASNNSLYSVRYQQRQRTS